MAILITQGDEVTLSLRCPNHDLTGATLTTAFEKTDGTFLLIDNSAHTVDADQVTNLGVFTVDLSSANTQEIILGKSSIVTKVEQTGIVRQFKGTDILGTSASPF